MKTLEAKELRTGNYFKWNSFASMGSGVDIITKDNHYIYKGFKEPIPLTEEWLLKFGFEKREYDDNNGYFFEYILLVEGLDGFRLEYQDDFSIGIMYNENQLAITPMLDRFKYVHQLQNLYFALTGEELTIKE